MTLMQNPALAQNHQLEWRKSALVENTGTKTTSFKTRRTYASMSLQFYDRSSEPFPSSSMQINRSRSSCSMVTLQYGRMRTRRRMSLVIMSRRTIKYHHATNHHQGLVFTWFSSSSNPPYSCWLNAVSLEHTHNQLPLCHDPSHPAEPVICLGTDTRHFTYLTCHNGKLIFWEAPTCHKHLLAAARDNRARITVELIYNFNFITTYGV